jgi:hypothetical protein
MQLGTSAQAETAASQNARVVSDAASERKARAPFAKLVARLVVRRGPSGRPIVIISGRRQVRHDE